MKLTVFVILFSWFLNSAMDAIDHGKGDQTLYLLWHILKWFSYAIPFGYILYLTGNFKIDIIFLLLVICRAMWEITYHILRHFDFWKLDNILKF